jgi:integration host factor subunit beta
MTKSELVYRLVAQKPALRYDDAERVVDTIFDEISAALTNGDRVELRGFGALTVRTRAARIGRNPRTGDAVHVPEKITPHFKTGKRLHDRLNGSA